MPNDTILEERTFLLPLKIINSCTHLVPQKFVLLKQLSSGLIALPKSHGWEEGHVCYNLKQNGCRTIWKIISPPSMQIANTNIINTVSVSICKFHFSI